MECLTKIKFWYQGYFGNVQDNWPKLFQAFSVKFTLIFSTSVFIQSFHISTCNKLCVLMQNCDF